MGRAGMPSGKLLAWGAAKLGRLGMKLAGENTENGTWHSACDPRNACSRSGIKEFARLHRSN